MPRRNLLPADHRINHQVIHGHDDLVGELATMYGKRGDFARHRFGDATETIDGYTRVLAEMLEPFDDDGQAATIAKNALHFAYSTAYALRQDGSTPDIAFGLYFDKLDTDTNEGRQEAIFTDTSDYLRDNPAIADLIDDHLGDIDVCGSHEELARRTAALIFLQMELGGELSHINLVLLEYEKELPNPSLN